MKIRHKCLLDQEQIKRSDLPEYLLHLLGALKPETADHSFEIKEDRLGGAYLALSFPSEYADGTKVVIRLYPWKDSLTVADDGHILTQYCFRNIAVNFSDFDRFMSKKAKALSLSYFREQGHFFREVSSAEAFEAIVKLSKELPGLEKEIRNQFLKEVEVSKMGVIEFLGSEISWELSTDRKFQFLKDEVRKPSGKVSKKTYKFLGFEISVTTSSKEE